MIARLIIVTTPLEKADDAEALWKKECAPLMIQQPGCLSEEFLRNTDDKSEMISVQRWESREAIEKYRASPAHAEILKHTRQLMGVSKVEVKNYQVVG